MRTWADRLPERRQIDAHQHYFCRASQDRQLPLHDADPRAGRRPRRPGAELCLRRHPRSDRGCCGGRRLGHDFLRHVERCRLLLHVVDVSGCEGRDPKADFEQINHELAGFSAELADRPQIVLGNKCDIASPEQVEEFKQYVEAKGLTFLPISAATRQGVDNLPALVYNRLKDLPRSGSMSRVQAPRQERPADPSVHGGAHRRPRVHRRCPVAGAYPRRYERRGLREPAVFPDAAG